MIKDIKFNRQHSEMIRVISQFKESGTDIIFLMIGEACFGFISTINRKLSINHRDFLYNCGLSGDVFEDNHKKPITTEVLFKTLPKISKTFQTKFTITFY